MVKGGRMRGRGVEIKKGLGNRDKMNIIVVYLCEVGVGDGEEVGGGLGDLEGGEADLVECGVEEVVEGEIMGFVEVGLIY